VRKWSGLVVLMTRIIVPWGTPTGLLGAAPVSTLVDVVAAPSGAVGLGSPGAAAGVPLTGGAGLTGACRGHGCRLGYRNGGGRMGPDGSGNIV
jgi:hypothetical protein